jgi:transcriptional regulator
MYQPDEFRDDSAERAYAHILRHPFGIIVTAHDGQLNATHLPFLLDDEEKPSGLMSHFAHRNEGLASLPDGEEVLVIFPGAQAYISPSLYQAEVDVPTWNYTAVHLHGVYRRVDETSLRAILERTVQRFEGHRAQPWQLGSLPDDVVRSLSRGVLGFAVEATHFEGGYKLSQDKLAEDVVAIETALRSSGFAADHDVADEMRRADVRGRTSPPTTDPDFWLGPLR